MALSKSDTSKFLDFFYRCRPKMYRCLPFRDYQIVLCELIEDSYYNFLAHHSGSLNDAIEQTKPLFEAYNRKPTFYVTPLSPEYNDNLLIEGLKLWVTDVWMKLTNPHILAEYAPPENIVISKIEESDKEEFVQVFAKAFSSEDPNDLYADLPDYYSKSLTHSLNDLSQEITNTYLKAEINGKMVGVASMFHDNYIAEIFSLGTMHAYRKQGVGKSFMKALLEIAQDANLTHVALRTISGSHVERWYQGIGFNSEFTATYYFLNQ